MKLLNKTLEIKKSRMILIWGAIFGLLFFLFFRTRLQIENYELSSGGLILLFLGSCYYGLGLVVGFYTFKDSAIKKITAIPLLGHMIYFVLLLFIATYAGLLLLPIWIYLKVVN